jgi:hypothetical protein
MRLLRQRRRDARELLAPAVAETLRSLDLDGRDAGVARLAVVCAETVDAAPNRAAALRWTGPLLLAALEQLDATPAAREPEQVPAAPSRLDQFRSVRRRPPV